MARLTKRLVEKISPSDGRDSFVWDNDLKGFGVRVWPSGRRVYVVRYRTRHRRCRMITLGHHGILTAEAARDRAREVLATARAGKDPSVRTEEVSFAETAQRYLAEHARPKKRPRSVREDERLLAAFLIPSFGKLPIDSITPADVAKLHSSMEQTPIQANRALACLSKIMGLSERWGLRPTGSNPCRHVQKYPEKKRERYLSDEEIGRLGSVLEKAEAQGGYVPSFLLLVRLLLFTGARLDEIRLLKWENVDLERGALRLADSKTGPRTITLGPSAAEILCKARQTAEGPWVCVGRKAGEPLVGVEKAWQRLRREARLEDVRLHDLRHSYASVGVGVGLGLPPIGALLGHRQPSTTARYAHIADTVRRRSADLIDEKLRAALGRGPTD